MRNMVTLGVFEERRGGRGVEIFGREYLRSDGALGTEYGVLRTEFRVPSLDQQVSSGGQDWGEFCEFLQETPR